MLNVTMTKLLAKIGIASTTSIALTETLKLDTLWNALLTLAISVVSVLAVEGVNWLREFIKSKTKTSKKEEEDNGNKESD